MVKPYLVDRPESSILSALVVEPRETDRTIVVFALESIGFRVTATDNFSGATEVLAAQAPFALVTTVRLGAYNGLELALRGRWIRPSMTALVTSDVPDQVLEREAGKAGATLVVKPLKTPELLAALYRTALRPPGPDGTIQPVTAPFERRHRERRQALAGDLDQNRRGSDRRDAAPRRLIRAAARN